MKRHTLAIALAVSALVLIGASCEQSTNLNSKQDVDDDQKTGLLEVTTTVSSSGYIEVDDGQKNSNTNENSTKKLEEENETEDDESDDSRETKNLPATNTPVSNTNNSNTQINSQINITVKTFTSAEVAKNNSASSCFIIVRGSVYNVTAFASVHPGGTEKILSLCGQDATAAFTQVHGGKQKQEDTLAKFKIGVLLN